MKQDIDAHLEGGSAYFECECRTKTADQDIWIVSGLAVWTQHKGIRFAGSAPTSPAARCRTRSPSFPGARSSSIA